MSTLRPFHSSRIEAIGHKKPFTPDEIQQQSIQSGRVRNITRNIRKVNRDISSNDTDPRVYRSEANLV
jgi:hypothetical protein